VSELARRSVGKILIVHIKGKPADMVHCQFGCIARKIGPVVPKLIQCHLSGLAGLFKNRYIRVEVSFTWIELSNFARQNIPLMKAAHNKYRQVVMHIQMT
jgi:hypothetical protein